MQPHRDCRKGNVTLPHGVIEETEDDDGVTLYSRHDLSIPWSDSQETAVIIDLNFAKATKDGLAKEKRCPLVFDNSSPNVRKRKRTKIETANIEGYALTDAAVSGHVILPPQKVRGKKVIILEHEGGLDGGNGDVAGPGVKNEMEGKSIDFTLNFTKVAVEDKGNLNDLTGELAGDGVGCFHGRLKADPMLVHHATENRKRTDEIKVVVEVDVGKLSVTILEGKAKVAESQGAVPHEGIEAGRIVENAGVSAVESDDLPHPIVGFSRTAECEKRIVTT